MKREPWAIANTFGYAVRVLNSIFCQSDMPVYTEEEKEMEEENKWLVAEQINSMCSDMMIEDAQDMLRMVQAMPINRLCEKVDCIYHHPKNPITHTFKGIFEDKCAECINNQKAVPTADTDYFDSE